MYRAIDIHGHFGDPGGFPQRGLERELLRMSLEELKAENDREDIRAVCLSPMEAIFPADERELLAANETMARLARDNPWVYQWVVVDPLFPASYCQAEQLLREKKTVGVKIHPDGNGYPIADHAEELFAFCRENGAALLSHSGDRLSLPEEFVPFADKYPEVTVILAHLGCGCDGCLEHQIRAVTEAKNGNIYTDVSSARSLLNGIVEWGVARAGSDKLLFGTDTPLHHIPMMKRRVETARLTEEQKADILYQNAVNLLLGGEEI